MLNVAIVAPRDELSRALREAMRLRFRGTGVNVVSVWHDRMYEGQQDPNDPVIARKILDENYAAIMRADVVLALTRDGVGRETYCEIGHALTLNGISEIVWSNERGGLSLSAHNARVRIVDTDAAAIERILALSEAARMLRILNEIKAVSKERE